MRRIVSFYGKIVSFITILVLVFAGIFMIPRLWGWKPFVVLSGSMEPAIPTGSVLFTDTYRHDAGIGEIITYKLDGISGESDTLVTHRVVRVIEKSEEQESMETLFITKGDSNEQEDLVPAAASQVIGTYLFHIPKVGWIISKLDRKLLITAAFWLLLLNVFGILFHSLFDLE